LGLGQSERRTCRRRDACRQRFTPRTGTPLAMHHVSGCRHPPMFEVPWRELFALSVPPVELVVRGTAIYWFLFLIFRVVLRRNVGSVAIADVLLLVIVADAAQNAMAGDYKSITDGMILVGTLIGWNVLIDWLTFRSDRLRRLLSPHALHLVREGRVLRENLRKEMLTDDELQAKLRENGVDDVGKVRDAFMESDGQVTVIKRDGEGDAKAKARRPV
jgi:uncharacterized membrane protein YcaP (DUF421 family)